LRLVAFDELLPELELPLEPFSSDALPPDPLLSDEPLLPAPPEDGCVLRLPLDELLSVFDGPPR
jgi:hypothetical protein